MSCHSSGSLKGVYPSSAEEIKDTLSNFRGLYSLFSAVERFLKLFWFDIFFFYLSLKDFPNQVFIDILKRKLKSFFNLRLRDCLD